MSDHCRTWFAEHHPENYPDKRTYMNVFMQYVAEGKDGEQRPGCFRNDEMFINVHTVHVSLYFYHIE